MLCRVPSRGRPAGQAQLTLAGRLAARVVDSHVHVWPDPQPGRPFPWPAEPDPNPIEALLPVLDEAGVDVAVQVTPSTLGYDNAYGVEAAERHPERVRVFGRLDPGAPAPRERLAEWMASPAADGVRFTFFHGTDESAAADAFFAAAADLAVPVAAYAPGGLAGLVRAVERHPGLRLIVDHLGLDVYGDAPFADWPLLRELVAHARVRVKISGLVETSREAFPFRDVHDRLAEAFELFGAERLLWGSNYPVVLNTCSYAESLTFLAACEFLTPAHLEHVLHRTFSDAVAREDA